MARQIPEVPDHPVALQSYGLAFSFRRPLTVRSREAALSLTYTSIEPFSTLTPFLVSSFCLSVAMFTVIQTLFAQQPYQALFRRTGAAAWL